ncbi:MAG TPA: sulfurtransferase TusA family protein [Symbiobacteriaceae bacterium]
MAPEDTAIPVPDRELDLRGDVCPITFAKTKIALEEMAVGQVLRVLVDYEPATRNVPRSVEMYGDQVLRVAPVAAHQWEILIRKQVE